MRQIWQRDPRGVLTIVEAADTNNLAFGGEKTLHVCMFVSMCVNGREGKNRQKKGNTKYEK